MDNRSVSTGRGAPASRRPPSTGPILRLLQITDTHIYADPAGELLGLNTLDSCERVLAMVQAREDNADLVVATGDLTHDGSEAGYRLLRDALKKIDLPVYCLPGNHDSAATLKNLMDEGQIRTLRALEHGDWSLVFLDSTVPGSETGHLADGELEHLRHYLASHRQRPTLVCMHHQPVPVGSAWIDTMTLDNPAPFFAIIDANPQVKGVLWGHIHQPFEQQRKGVRLIGSPSTCVQFKPQSDVFTLDDTPPGYRWLELYADGAITTGIRRVDAYTSGIDMESPGY